METTEEYRQRIINVSDERNEFVTDVDGFVYWCPDGSPNGHLASHHLRWLADELDRRNEKWLRRHHRRLFFCERSMSTDTPFAHDE